MPVHLALMEDPPAGVSGVCTPMPSSDCSASSCAGAGPACESDQLDPSGAEPLGSIAAFMGRPPRPGVRPSPSSRPTALFETLVRGAARTLERVSRMVNCPRVEGDWTTAAAWPAADRGSEARFLLSVPQQSRITLCTCRPRSTTCEHRQAQDARRPVPPDRARGNRRQAVALRAGGDDGVPATRLGTDHAHARRAVGLEEAQQRTSECADDVLDPVLRVAEEHGGVLAEEERVLYARVSGGH